MFVSAELEKRLASCTCAQNAKRRLEEEKRAEIERAALKSENDKRLRDERLRRAAEEQERKEYERVHEMEVLKLKAELSAAKLAAHAAERALTAANAATATAQAQAQAAMAAAAAASAAAAATTPSAPSPVVTTGTTTIIERRSSLLTKAALLAGSPLPARGSVVLITPTPTVSTSTIATAPDASAASNVVSPPKLIEPPVVVVTAPAPAPVPVPVAAPSPSQSAAALALDKRRESFDAIRSTASEMKSRPKWILNSSQQQELAALSRVMNFSLAADTDLTLAIGGGSPLIPIEPASSELLTKVRDGLLLAKVWIKLSAQSDRHSPQPLTSHDAVICCVVCCVLCCCL